MIDRKLAAILAADVVGYSRLMSDGETETLAALRTLTDEVTGPTVTRFNGRVFKRMGDGFLAEFGSVFAASECAQSIQDQIAGRNADLPESRRLVLRIGIHLGEVVVDGDDLVGDGVNLASRIEGTADPGGINLSRAAYDNLRGRMPGVGFEDLGEVSLKNIDEPMQLFRLLPVAAGPPAVQGREVQPTVHGLDRRAVPARRRRGHRLIWSAATIAILLIAVGGVLLWPGGPPRPGPPPSHDPVAEVMAPAPSLAVLPFEALSEAVPDSGLVDGLAGVVTAALSRIPELVLAPQAEVRSLPADLQSPYDIADALEVGYLLTGTLQLGADRVRADADLLSAETGESLWSQQFDLPADDPFAVQDAIADEATQAVLVTLIEGEQALIPLAYTDLSDAYENYLLGMAELHDLTKEASQRAIERFAQAVDLDPDFLPARLGLAWTRFIAVSWGWSDAVVDDLIEAAQITDEVLAIDGGLSTAHALRAQLYLWDGRYDEALEASRRSIELSPNNADNTIMAAIVALHAGTLEETVGLARRAVELSPYPPAWYFSVLAETRRRDGDPRGALGLLAAIRQRMDNALPIEIQIVWTAQDADEIDLVDRAARRVMELSPGFSVSSYVARLPERNPDTAREIGELLRESNLPD